MNKCLATKHVILGLAAIGLFASAAGAQNYNTSDPGSAPLASPTGGRPVPVDAADVRRDNTTYATRSADCSDR